MLKKLLLSRSVTPFFPVCRVFKQANLTRTESTVASNNIRANALNQQSNHSYFEFSQNLCADEKLKVSTTNCMQIHPDFINESEETSLMNEIEPYMSRLTYEDSHWDQAIHHYRETERSKWTKANEIIINRIRTLAFPPGVLQLKMIHVLDLAKDGVIKPHIDSIRFCGNVIAGLSLLSTSIMRLVHEDDKTLYCDVLLPRRSLYIMKDLVRFKFTHEILANEPPNIFNGQVVIKDRRISVMCRNEPDRDPVENSPVNELLKKMEHLSKIK